MKVRIPVIYLALLLATGADAANLPVEIRTQVVFQLPLNLTQLPAGLTKLRVECNVHGPAVNNSVAARDGSQSTHHARAYVELPVSGGQIVTTASVTVEVLLDETTLDSSGGSGSNANYDCGIMGYSGSSRSWQDFDPAHADPTLRISPNPVPLTGGFTW
ncbi:MAG: hypothetical protein ACREST_06305 [Steroidobacteraceae bacterium]